MPDSDALTVPTELLEFIRDHNVFVIAGHKEPDGDCVGSQLALAGVLRRIRKTVYLVNPGPFDRQEIAEQERLFSPTLAATGSPSPAPDAVIVLDCSSADRIGAVADEIQDLPIAVIDHHSAGERFGDIRFIRTDIPATTILVYAVIESLGIDLEPGEAQALFLGLATDTGFFRFLEPNQDLAFTVAASLSKAGASPREADRVVSTGRSMESRLLLARLLQRVERLKNGAVLLTYQTLADEREFGNRRDSDALYRLLLAVDGVRVVVVAKEKPDGTAISFRSTDDTDVGVLAASFNGGGHQKAAGAFVPQELPPVLPQLRSSLIRLTLGQ